MDIARVLIVDDEPDLRLVASHSLRAIGKWEVLQASSGEEAIETARAQRPDVILLDMMMPQMDGLQTLEHLRADATTSGIPVIFMTARIRDHEVSEYRQRGAAGVIGKPFEPMGLPDEVRRIVDSWVPAPGHGQHGRSGGPGHESDADSEDARQANHADVPRPVLLVVEDDEDLRRFVSHALAGHGMDIVEAGDLAAAADASARHDVALALVDGLLPDGNGMQALEEIREAHPDAALVFMSAFVRDPAMVMPHARRLRLASVLSKPFTAEQLVVHVDAALQHRPEGDRGMAREGGALDVGDADPGIDALVDGYAMSLHMRISELEEAVRATSDTGSLEGYDLATRLAHRLHGTAGTFGYLAVSGAAGAIELAAREAVERGAPVARFEWESLLAQLRVAAAAARTPIAAAPTTSPDAGGAHRGPAGSARASSRFRRFAVWGPAGEQRTAIERAILDHDGMVVDAGHPARDDGDAARRRIDGGIVVVEGPGDVVVDEAVAGLRAAADRDDLPIAVFWCDPPADAAARTMAAGASLVTGCSTAGDEVAGVLERLTEIAHAGDPRVLVLDDDEAFRREVASLLADDGMDVRCIDSAEALVPTLSDHRPDVLLIDADLPFVGGLDLCRMLRSSGRWSELPIMLVTTGASPRLRVACFQSGADDYVDRPIVPQELVARVRSRADRSIAARARATVDPLTGLTLRSVFHEGLERAHRHANRRGEQFSVALIDLDHFKRVNDTHGHHAGDLVLAAFGRMLRSSFRAEDLRARWGGEEFAVLLDGCPAGHAAMVLDLLRERFAAQELHGPDGQRLSMSLSCGVATYPDDADTISALIDVADRRLYEAKSSGRNRVVAAEAARHVSTSTEGAGG